MTPACFDFLGCWEDIFVNYPSKCHLEIPTLLREPLTFVYIIYWQDCGALTFRERRICYLMAYDPLLRIR